MAYPQRKAVHERERNKVCEVQGHHYHLWSVRGNRCPCEAGDTSDAPLLCLLPLSAKGRIRLRRKEGRKKVGWNAANRIGRSIGRAVCYDRRGVARHAYD